MANPQQLIALLRAQDSDAFTSLVKEYHPRLLAFAVSIANKELAEEIMQDAWIAIYKGLPNFEARASLKTWLYTIIRNEAINKSKKEGKQQQFTNTTTVDDDPNSAWYESQFISDGHWNTGPTDWSVASPDGLLEEEQLRYCIEFTMNQLKDQQRQVFILKDMEKLPDEEICNILKLSHSNVRVLLHRARLQLLQVIDRYMETGEC